MHEIHLGPSGPRAFSPPSASVTDCPRFPSARDEFRRGFFVIYVQFISLSHSLSYFSLCPTHSFEDKEFTFGVTRSHL